MWNSALLISVITYVDPIDKVDPIPNYTLTLPLVETSIFIDASSF
jgi:hypothetical protein